MTAPNPKSQNVTKAALPGAPVATLVTKSSDALWNSLGWTNTANASNIGAPDGDRVISNTIVVKNATLPTAPSADVGATAKDLWADKGWAIVP